MRTSIQKTLLTLLLALLLALLFLFPAAALGEARFPVNSGALTDDANVIGQTMAQQITDYAQLVESETDVHLHVALVLFWDGETAQAYTDQLFARWGLGKDDVLLAGAVAEDTFAVTLGKDVQDTLSSASVNGLLYSSGFAENFRNQQYDAAFGNFFVSLNTLLNKQYGQSLQLDSLFAAYQSPADDTQASETYAGDGNDFFASLGLPSNLWSNTMDTIGQNVEQYQTRQQNEGTHGITTGGWVVLVVLALIVFGQSNRARRSGCGCSPIGWILGGLGLGALFNRNDGDRDDRHFSREYQREYRREYRHSHRR